MKHLRLFNESKKSKEFYIQEILSKRGWKKVETPDRDNWLVQLEYQLTDSVKIVVLDLDNSSRELPYYMKGGEDFNYVSSYSDNYTQLFSDYDIIYKNMSNYERMMRICNYLLPFYEKELDNNLIEDIKDCFISIEDESGIEVDIEWGYCDINNEEFGFFPAFRFSDKLCLSLIYNHYGKVNYDDILEVIEEGIDRCVNIYDIHKSYIKTFNHYDWRIIIRIEF
jgi:hypothetical protein